MTSEEAGDFKRIFRDLLKSLEELYNNCADRSVNQFIIHFMFETKNIELCTKENLRGEVQETLRRLNEVACLSGMISPRKALCLGLIPVIKDIWNNTVKERL